MTPPDARSTERFSDRVDDYVRYRPRYPVETLGVLQEAIGFAREWVLADVGSGVGLSTEPFLRHGNLVYAVEPNAAMRTAAERRLGSEPNFCSVDGAAEATTLPDASLDAVVAAQALHWFDAAAARREFRRILRPGGWVVVLWNTRRLAGAPIHEAYEALLERHGTDYRQVRHDHAAPARCAILFDSQPVVERRLPNWQRLDRDGFRGRILSASYVPAAGQPGYEALCRDADRVFDEHQRDGWVTIEYDLEIVAGRVDGP